MATVLPFRALRPEPSRAEEVASVPYDVIDSDEARQLADGRPFSFLHVIRPEIDFPPGTDDHADEVYAAGKANLDRLAESSTYVEDERPALYVYRLEMGDQVQHGIFGLVSVQEYDRDLILKHEKTRPDKEDDRTRHILTQRAHAEPVMLTYRGDPRLDIAVQRAVATAPLYDFTAEDGVKHTIWKAVDAIEITTAFASVPNLYVADGHHRCAAASRVARELPDEPGAQYFMAVLFPVSEMQILPYNRVVYRLPEGPKTFITQLRERFNLEDPGPKAPARPGRASIYVAGTWYGLALPETERDGVASGLDVARLQEHVLEPLLRIGDVRLDPNIGFVGGIRGTGELERLVDDGRAQAAFSMYPTSAEDLLRVSDAGELMPPKSTWFEPKLRSGLLVHRF
jgi:uncharacterized protein (DUF1015 family)